MTLDNAGLQKTLNRKRKFSRLYSMTPIKTKVARNLSPKMFGQSFLKLKHIYCIFFRSDPKLTMNIKIA